VEATFAAMSIELTQEVSSRLTTENFGWLTTVAKSGQPVPRLVWFYFDGTRLTVYSMPQAAKVTHIKAHPQVSLNLDSDGRGGGIVVIGGTAAVDATDVNCKDDAPYWAKYGELAKQLESSEGISMDAFSTRLAINPTKAWTTPA
jgi:PPOX class probable F420-dependent enzyme